MKRLPLPLLVGIFVVGAIVSVYGYQSHFGPSGLLYYDEARSYGGYNLITPLRPGPAPDFGYHATYLIDMEGNVINSWPLPQYGYTIEKQSQFLDNGNLLRRIGNDTWQHGWDESWPGTDPEASPTDAGRLQELDWDGNIIREIVDTRPGYHHHHTFERIFNRKLQAFTILSIASKDITHEQAIAAGVDPSLRDDYTSFPDGVVEFDLDGNVIWEWNVFDHLVQDVDPTKDNYGVVRDHPEKMDPNFGPGRRGNWIHMNSMDYNETLGQIVVNNSVNAEFYVIDHQGTFIPGDPAGSIATAAGDAGDFLFRWGNPAVYDSGEGKSFTEKGGASDGDQQVFFSHDIQWIRPTAYPEGPALPGAGHFLIFDNGTRHLATGNAYSALLEIDPYDGPMENGVYVRQESAGYHNVRVYSGARRTSDQVVWFYASRDPASFWSRHISGLTRLPNGNTMVTGGTWGQLFELTPDNEIVWEYKLPIVNDTGPKKILEDGDFAQSFVAFRYGSDHPALRGRDLTPKGQLVDVED